MSRSTIRTLSGFSAVGAVFGGMFLLATVLVGALVSAGCTDSGTAVIYLGDERLDVFVADSTGEMSKGLQGFEQLGPGEGMLFVWDSAERRSFAIKDVDYDLDVVFIGPDAVVTQVSTLSPDGPKQIESADDVRWVIEVPRGWPEEHEVGPGTVFRIE